MAGAKTAVQGGGPGAGAGAGAGGGAGTGTGAGKEPVAKQPNPGAKPPLTMDELDRFCGVAVPPMGVQCRRSLLCESTQKMPILHYPLCLSVQALASRYLVRSRVPGAPFILRLPARLFIIESASCQCLFSSGKYHGEGSKRLVEGRSLPYNVLVQKLRAQKAQAKAEAQQGTCVGLKYTTGQLSAV